jgi:hypothetical protein
VWNVVKERNREAAKNKSEEMNKERLLSITTANLEL